MRRWLLISLLINVLLLTIALFAVRRLGGWRFAMYRWQHSETPLYQHRRQLFEQMPRQSGAIIFLGDSQTALCEWQELFGPTFPILNRGIVGDHVDGVHQRLSEVLRHQPARIFLLIGVNDLLFGKSVEDIASDYHKIIAEIQMGSPSASLVIQSILPVNNVIKNVGVQNAQIQILNARIAKIARDNDLPFVDIYRFLTDANGNLDEQFTADGIHLNGAGYQLWKQQLAPYMAPQNE